MTQTIAHFVFTVSGGGCLVQALRKAGRDDPVVATCHDMNFGPIDPSDASSRTKWLEDELGLTDRKSVGRGSARVWDEALYPDHRKVAWLTRRSAEEYAGFLDWLWHRGDTPCDVVDLSEVKISYPPELDPSRPPALAVSLATLHHDTIRHNKLWDLAEPLQMTERRRYREIWQQLCLEGAPLRVIDGDKLVSAPISFFDSLLISCVTSDWQKVSRVCGLVTLAQRDADLHQIDNTFLEARIRVLVASGRLDIRVKSEIRMSAREVRLRRP